MTDIVGEILIRRPPEEVFDFVADERNEPSYNPKMARVALLTPEPVRLGSRFLATVVSGGRPIDMTVELTSFDRPRRLGAATHMRAADIQGTLVFEPVADGTRMRWDWEVQPKGALRALTSLVLRTGRREERAIWTNLKHLLERPQHPAPAHE